MNILSIGNSFSEDAHRYLYEVAKADKFKITAVNLNIGGCSMSMHYKNMLGNKKVYNLMFNGIQTGFLTSIEEGLLSRNYDDWDIITIQQVSHHSVNYETFQPYLTEVIAFLKKYSPKAKIYLQQTWAYEKESKRLTEELGYSKPEEMFSDIKGAYEKAAKDINADGVIRSGELFMRMLDAGIEKVHRDTFHASYGLGRYALGLLWYKTLTGNDITDIELNSFDEDVNPDEIRIVKKCINEMF